MATSTAPLLLLVEDSDDDAFFFRRTVKQCGIPCQLIHVVDGMTAIKELERLLGESAQKAQRPDFVFLDLKVPGFDGFEILAWIREQRFDPPLSVAVLSGSDDAADVRRAKSLGALEYFTKPLSPDRLRSWLAGAGGPSGALAPRPAWESAG